MAKSPEQLRSEIVEGLGHERPSLKAGIDALDSLVEQVQALEAACDHHRMFWQKAEERERGLKEQLESAEAHGAQAEAFIAHMDMGYCWVEWLESHVSIRDTASNPVNRDSNPASTPDAQKGGTDA